MHILYPAKERRFIEHAVVDCDVKAIARRREKAIEARSFHKDVLTMWKRFHTEVKPSKDSVNRLCKAALRDGFSR
jgi:hypothetical protein